MKPYRTTDWLPKHAKTLSGELAPWASLHCLALTDPSAVEAAVVMMIDGWIIHGESLPVELCDRYLHKENWLGLGERLCRFVAFTITERLDKETLLEIIKYNLKVGIVDDHPPDPGNTNLVAFVNRSRMVGA